MMSIATPPPIDAPVAEPYSRCTYNCQIADEGPCTCQCQGVNHGELTRRNRQARLETELQQASQDEEP